ncbi:MAG: N-acetylmuramoyl-L-alanine amidase [Litoreibacter sp.]|nr:N-acetylmuramoyl-L-alanine amidase [Litoreibacter sp.]
MIRALLIACCAAFLSVVSAAAEDLRALARLDPLGSSIVDVDKGVIVTLAITQAVPYRVFTLSDPKRVVIEFREVAFGSDADLEMLDRSELIMSVTGGPSRPGWSQMQLELSEPLEVTQAALRTDAQDGDAIVSLLLGPTSEDAFLDAVEASNAAITTDPTQGDDGALVVVLDPGHGGVDPGAQRQGYDEADLMLKFAQELKDALLRGGVDRVALTRTDDSFVSLPARISIARAAGADLLISLHADALAEGYATGTTVYTLSEEASDRASALLAERQDRQDILAGVDLREQDDQIATILMSLARLETAPRADRLAETLVESLRESIGKLNNRPRRSAGFSVLKAQDIPSVLIELGFMSAQEDLDNLLDAEWRKRAAAGIVNAVTLWALDEQARG